MQITFLGKSTQGGGSPTLYATDRNSYIVQGWKVPGRRLRVEIPTSLLAFLEPGTRLAADLVYTGRDTVVLDGAAVTDQAVLAQMDIPDHETCIEVGKVWEGVLRGATAG